MSPQEDVVSQLWHILCGGLASSVTSRSGKVHARGCWPRSQDEWLSGYWGTMQHGLCAANGDLHVAVECTSFIVICFPRPPLPWGQSGSKFHSVSWPINWQ